MLLLANIGLPEAAVMIFAIAVCLLPAAVIAWAVFFYWFIQRRNRTWVKRPSSPPPSLSPRKRSS